MTRAKRWIVRGVLAVAVVLFGLAGGIGIQAHRRPALPPFPTTPAAAPGAPLTVRFAGVATLVFDDGETAWMADGFFSRPSLARVVFTRVGPNPAAIDAGLHALGVTRLAAVVPLHSHYDHAMDAPRVAQRTGALLVGTESTLNLGRGAGLPAARLRLVQPGDALSLGHWTLTFLVSRHAPVASVRPGEIQTIDAPLVPPMHATAWREGGSWALLVQHASGRRWLVLGSAGFVPGALQGLEVETVFLGVAGIAAQPAAYRDAWWHENVRLPGARRVVPIHWDDFTLPAREPLPALPYLVDDVGMTLRELEGRARREGVAVAMPRLWRPFEP